jgi:hypothetical protein
MLLQTVRHTRSNSNSAELTTLTCSIAIIANKDIQYSDMGLWHIEHSICGSLLAQRPISKLANALTLLVLYL